jgi:5-methyltetrahydropteroyltriglutamate--homocysteine methyltransferase
MAIPTELIGSIPRPLDLVEAVTGHIRRMHRLTGGPFRYRRYADSYLDAAKRYTQVPLKQAVISPSALSLMYPDQGIPGYPREKFIDDLLREHESEIRRCLQKGAHKVQIDFTEGRLAIKIDPSGNLLQSFIDLNNLALARFSAEERKRIGVPTSPGADCDATHSADVDYAELLPSLFELQVGNFYIALAGEKDRVHVHKMIREYMKPGQRIFIGVIATIDPRIETPEEVRDRILEAAVYTFVSLCLLLGLGGYLFEVGWFARHLINDSDSLTRHRFFDPGKD